MNNKHTSSHSQTEVLWSTHIVSVADDEKQFTQSQPGISSAGAFMQETVVISESFKNYLHQLTRDPLAVFGILVSGLSLLFHQYQPDAVTLSLPALSDSGNGALLPVNLPAASDSTLKQYLGQSLQAIEDALNQEDKSASVSDNSSGILIYADWHTPPANEAAFPVRIKISLETDSIQLRYQPQAFSGQIAKRMQQHWQALEQELLTGDKVLAALNVVGEEEREYLFSRNQPLPAVKKGSVVDLFRESVQRYPDNAAVLFEGKTITYRELDEKSSRLACYFIQEMNVQPGSTVALMMQRSDAMIIAILGILKSGAAYVPVDPSYPKERIEYLLTQSGAGTLVLSSAQMFDVPFFTGQLFAIDLQLDELPEADETLLPVVNSGQLAYMIFTSGSTGKPKGVEVMHGSVVNYLTWAAGYYFTHNTEGGSFPLFTPVSFDLTVTSVFIPLLKGKMVEVYGEEDTAAVLGNIFSEAGVADTVKLTPSHLLLLAEMPAGPCPVRTIIAGGEALREDHVAIVRDKWPDIQLFNEYGPTEATVGCTVALIEDNINTIGQPITGAVIYLLNSHRQLLPAGVAGEIYIGGHCLARGYRGLPEQTALSFIDSPFEAGQKLYRTGDMGVWQEDGTLQYLGRRDAQLKIRGYRIEPGEIEQVLLLVPGIKDAAVVARRHNGHDTYLAAFYVTEQDNITEEQLKQHYERLLPVYMRPVQSVRLAAMPFTPNYKTDRQQLAVMDIQEKNDRFEAPVSDMEKALSAIFCEVLGRKKVGLHDGFFALGGDSIIGIQIVSRANREGIAITLKQLFKELSIANLAAVAGKASQPQAVQTPVHGTIPQTPVMQWFFEQEFPAMHQYTQSVLLETAGKVNVAVLEKALAAVITHHDALRMRIRKTNGAWEAYVPEQVAMDARITVKEFLVPDAAKWERLLKEDLEQQQQRLDIVEGPVITAKCYGFNEGKSMVFLLAHHLVVDGVSWRILLEDLATVYQQLLAAKPVLLPAKTTAFAAWATALLNYSASPALAGEYAFWTAEQRMSSKALPVDHHGQYGMNTVANMQVHSLQLTEAETQALLAEVHSAYNTNINDILLSALLLAFHRYTGRPDVLVAMEGHGREEILDNVDITRTIGWFTSVYPVLLECGNGGDTGAVIRAVKETLRAIPHHGIGYGLLKYGYAPAEVKEAVNAQPQPQIIFNYLGQSEQSLPAGGPWQLSAIQAGGERADEQQRSYVFEINAIVVNRQMMIDWAYCNRLHNAATIQTLTGYYLQALQELIAHCREVGSGNFTPSDFPDAGLQQEQLDLLISQFKLPG